MCLKDIIHFRRWQTNNTAGALPAATFIKIANADPRRICLTIVSINASGFAAGERTIIHLGPQNTGAGDVAVLTKENPQIKLHLAEFGSSLLDEIWAVTNAAGNDIVTLVDLVTNEDDYTLTHSP